MGFFVWEAVSRVVTDNPSPFEFCAPRHLLGVVTNNPSLFAAGNLPRLSPRRHSARAGHRLTVAEASATALRRSIPDGVCSSTLLREHSLCCAHVWAPRRNRT